MRDLLKEDCLTHEIDRVFISENRFGQPGEGGEFVDHRPQRADLAYDRTGQLVEQRIVVAHLLAIATLEPFGCELDRGERVLDLVRNPTRNIGPGSAALIEQLPRDILECDHMPAGCGRDTHRQRQQVGTLRHGDDAAFHPLVEQRGDLRRDRGKGLAPPFLGRILEQQEPGRGVHELDRAALVDRDDACTHRLEHRLDKGAPFVDLAVCPH